MKHAPEQDQSLVINLHCIGIFEDILDLKCYKRNMCNDTINIWGRFDEYVCVSSFKNQRQTTTCIGDEI